MASLVAQRAFASRSSAFVASPVAPVRRVVALAPAKAVTVEVEAKMKTRKAVAKRLRVTGSGKVVGRRAGKQHFNEKQSTNTKRELSHMFVVKECDLYKVARCLPYAGLAK